MWSESKKFLFSWTGKVVLISSVGLALYLLLRSKPKPPSSFVRIEILSKESLLKLLTEVRIRYSLGFIELRQDYRTQRRKTPTKSPAYSEIIREYHTRAQGLLHAESKRAFGDFGVSEEVVDHSLAFYAGDTEVEKAKNLMNEPYNNAVKPRRLSKDMTIEVLEYFKAHLNCREEDDMEEYMVSVAHVEDDIARIYGFEAEELEKAYDEYEADLQAVTMSLKEQTVLFLQQSSNDDFGEDSAPTLQA